MAKKEEAITMPKIIIHGSKAYTEYLYKHLKEEHPSVKRRGIEIKKK